MINFMLCLTNRFILNYLLYLGKVLKQQAGYLSMNEKTREELKDEVHQFEDVEEDDWEDLEEESDEEEIN